MKLTNVKAFSVQLSALSHSCLPNAAIINNGLNIELRAMTQIPIGNQITINCVELVFNTNKRQEILSDNYYINCKCLRCESNFDSDIDYERLHYLDSYLLCESVRVPNSMINSKKRLKLVNERMDLYKKCFNGLYNPKYSHFLFINLISLFICEVGDKQTIEEYIKEVDNNLIITHGKDNEVYNVFLGTIALFGYQLNDSFFKLRSIHSNDSFSPILQKIHWN
jgi:hypothetical protein